MLTPSEHFQAAIDLNASFNTPAAFDALARGLKGLADQIASLQADDPRLDSIAADLAKIRVYLGTDH